jgi:uncharacterized membrane protein YgaE (UPF0421/DUF939 family)
MKKLLTRMGGTMIGVLFALLIIAALYAISWITTCGVIYLITLCFNWTFSWGIATGVWLVMAILRSVFKSNVTVKK